MSVLLINQGWTDKDDNRVIETHDGKEKDMIAIRLSDVEYAEIFN